MDADDRPTASFPEMTDNTRLTICPIKKTVDDVEQKNRIPILLQVGTGRPRGVRDTSDLREVAEHRY